MIDVGDPLPDLAVETRDDTGTLANAGSVVLTITLPDGTTTLPAVTNPSTGRYEAVYLTVQAGIHHVRWVATGVNSSAYKDTYNVDPGTAGALLSMSEARRQLNISTTGDDDELRDWIGAITPVIERHIGKTILRTTKVERRYLYGYTTMICTRTKPIISLTSIVTLDSGGPTWGVTSTDVDIDADAGTLLALIRPWYGNLKITYVAGMTAVPNNYAKAAGLILQHLWSSQRGKERGAPYVGGGLGSVTATPGAGYTSYGYLIPEGALELLGPPARVIV